MPVVAHISSFRGAASKAGGKSEPKTMKWQLHGDVEEKARTICFLCTQVFAPTLAPMICSNAVR